MRFAAYQPRGRFRGRRTGPYQFDLPVITGGFILTILFIITASFVYPLSFNMWHRFPGVKDYVRPVYPEAALSSGIVGDVLIRFTVKKDGTVMNPEILEADPPDLFDQAVLTAVSQWKYGKIYYLATGSSMRVIRHVYSAPPGSRFAVRPWYDIEEVVYGEYDDYPRLVRKVDPDLPAPLVSAALAKSNEKRVIAGIVTFTVDGQGRVLIPRLERHLSHHLARDFEKAIFAAVRAWVFTPARLNGKPVSALVSYRVIIPES